MYVLFVIFLIFMFSFIFIPALILGLQPQCYLFLSVTCQRNISKFAFCNFYEFKKNEKKLFNFNLFLFQQYFI